MLKALKKVWKWISAPFRWVGGMIARPFKKVAAFFGEEPEDAPVVDSLQLAFEEPASFLEHIGALRKHLLRSLIVLIICAIVAFSFMSQVLEFIAWPIDGMDQLTAVDVTEPISGSTLLPKIILGHDPGDCFQPPDISVGFAGSSIKISCKPVYRDNNDLSFGQTMILCQRVYL